MAREVKTLTDFTLPEGGTVDIPRGDEPLRVPIKAISLELQEHMDDKFKLPPPPRKFDKKGQYTDTGRPGFYVDAQDPLYVEQVEAVNTERVKAMMIEGLGVEIPGKDYEEKWSALKKRLTIGDLAMILEGIMEISNISDSKVEEAKNSLLQS
jgi:hypothetical protein